MFKLIRSSIVTAAAAWAWKNRSTIVDKFGSKPDRADPGDTATGYGEVVGRDGLMTKPEFKGATTT